MGNWDWYMVQIHGDQREIAGWFLWIWAATGWDSTGNWLTIVPSADPTALNKEPCMTKPGLILVPGWHWLIRLPEKAKFRSRLQSSRQWLRGEQGSPCSTKSSGNSGQLLLPCRHVKELWKYRTLVLGQIDIYIFFSTDENHWDVSVMCLILCVSPRFQEGNQGQFCATCGQHSRELRANTATDPGSVTGG